MPKKENWKRKNGRRTAFCRITGSQIKTKKCQPAAGDTPDLIQTEFVANSGLARPKKENWKRKNGRRTDFCRITDAQIKTKKCQPAASDTPFLIQTECVTDSSLALPKNKELEHEARSRVDSSLPKIKEFEHEACSRVDSVK